MTEQEKEILKTNRLIAEFMGYIIHHNDTPQSEMPIGVKHIKDRAVREYHNSWGYLMQVVEKVENIEAGDFKCFAVCIEKDECEIKDYRDGQSHVAFQGGSDKLKSTYNALIDFIKYYNEILKP